MAKVVGMWHLSVDCSNDLKSAGQEKEVFGTLSPEDWGMQNVCTKMVPRLMNASQKESRMQVCQDIIERLQTETDLLNLGKEVNQLKTS